MFFQKKINKIIDVQKAEERFEEEFEDTEFHGKDILSMILAGFLVFFPALLLVMGIFLFLIWFFFLRFV